MMSCFAKHSEKKKRKGPHHSMIKMARIGTADKEKDWFVAAGLRERVSRCFLHVYFNTI